MKKKKKTLTDHTQKRSSRRRRRRKSRNSRRRRTPMKRRKTTKLLGRFGIINIHISIFCSNPDLSTKQNNYYEEKNEIFASNPLPPPFFPFLFLTCSTFSATHIAVTSSFPPPQINSFSSLSPAPPSFFSSFSCFCVRGKISIVSVKF